MPLRVQVRSFLLRFIARHISTVANWPEPEASDIVGKKAAVAAAPTMSPGASPNASAHLLRRLRQRAVVTGEQAEALESLLRQHLPWPLWIGRSLLAFGAGLLLTGAVFFFAYNWNNLPPAAKFALAEGGLTLCALAAWILGIERPGGKMAVFGACVFTGAFLAVHGQIYQTGADDWQLFAAWSALTLPWAALARLPALWVFWLGLVNTALVLEGFETRWFFLLDDRAPQLFLTSMAIVNAVALAAWEAGVQRRWRWMEAGWVRAILIVTIFGMLTAAVCTVILGGDRRMGAWVWLAWLAAAAFSYWFYRRVRPSLPCLSVVVLSICSVAVTLVSYHLAGGFLLIAIEVMAIFYGAVSWLQAEGRAIRERREPA